MFSLLIRKYISNNRSAQPIVPGYLARLSRVMGRENLSSLHADSATFASPQLVSAPAEPVQQDEAFLSVSESANGSGSMGGLPASLESKPSPSVISSLHPQTSSSISSAFPAKKLSVTAPTADSDDEVLEAAMANLYTSPQSAAASSFLG